MRKLRRGGSRSVSRDETTGDSPRSAAGSGGQGEHGRGSETSPLRPEGPTSCAPERIWCVLGFGELNRSAVGKTVLCSQAVGANNSPHGLRQLALWSATSLVAWTATPWYAPVWLRTAAPRSPSFTSWLSVALPRTRPLPIYSIYTKAKAVPSRLRSPRLHPQGRREAWGEAAHGYGLADTTFCRRRSQCVIRHMPMRAPHRSEGGFAGNRGRFHRMEPVA
jgi:hypothetical protein